MDARRSQSALYHHQRRPGKLGANALRARLLRTRRHGEPDQGTTAGSLCRPDQHGEPARQPIAAVIFDPGLSDRQPTAPGGASLDRTGAGHLRDDPAEALQDGSLSPSPCAPGLGAAEPRLFLGAPFLGDEPAAGDRLEARRARRPRNPPEGLVLRRGGGVLKTGLK